MFCSGFYPALVIGLEPCGWALYTGLVYEELNKAYLLAVFFELKGGLWLSYVHKRILLLALEIYTWK